MSNVQTLQHTAHVYPNAGRYTVTEMACGKHRATVMVGPDYVQVVVANASNRAWRGMGKRFTSISAAIASYKTQELRDMIAAAEALTEEYDAKCLAAVACGTADDVRRLEGAL